MTAGRLASKYLSAATNTVVYSADIDSTASVMVTAANWSGGAATYRLGLRDYDQILRVSGCLLYTSPSPRDATLSRMPSSA